MLLNYHLLNGTIIHKDQLNLSPADLGFSRGFAIFEYFQWHKGNPFLHHYLQRFYNAAQTLQLPIPYRPAELTSWLHTLARLNQTHHLAFRLFLTGGHAEHAWLPIQKPTFLILCETVPPVPNEWLNQGWHLKTVEYLRPLPNIKTTFYGPALALLQRYQRAGYHDILFTWQGAILELPRSNFFLIRQGTLYTPARNILPGITRQIILEVAQHLLPTREILHLPYHWIYDADEAFITGSTKPVIPICTIDNHPIGNGTPGPLTTQLRQELQKRLPQFFPSQ